MYYLLQTYNFHCCNFISFNVLCSLLCIINVIVCVINHHTVFYNSFRITRLTRRTFSHHHFIDLHIDFYLINPYLITFLFQFTSYIYLIVFLDQWTLTYILGSIQYLHFACTHTLFYYTLYVAVKLCWNYITLFYKFCVYTGTFLNVYLK